MNLDSTVDACMRYVTHMGDTRNAWQILVGKLKERIHFTKLGVGRV
jgi:hypothetical protein